MNAPAPYKPPRVALIELDALRELVSEAVAAATSTEPKPALLDQAALARELSVSVRTVYTLRQEGLPTVMIGESPRFELAAVLEWLRARGVRVETPTPHAATCTQVEHIRTRPNAARFLGRGSHGVRVLQRSR